MKQKRIFGYCLLAAILCLLSCKDRNYERVGGDPMQTRIYTLDNGLKVYLSVNKEEPRIQAYIAVRTGSKNDPCRDDRPGSLSGAPHVQGNQAVRHHRPRGRGSSAGRD